jgi:Tol biopolymer transport system component
MALSAGTKLGSYEILQTIGAGGMGEVYKATDTRLGRPVAIKVLIAQFSSQTEFKDRFEREAQTIAGLTHPNVCTLYDIGKQDGMDFLVMEFLEGETLAARLARGPLPLDEALRVAIQIADALDKAHTLGVTHRDLKPANIMLMKSGAKLMDFGLAKRRASVEGGSASILPTAMADLTQHGSIIGTVQYMAPEQVEGEEADPRTDIFAFGMVLYEMITGKKAFSGKSQASLMASILNGQPEPMSSIQAQAPPALQRVVEICLAKDPRDRWQTAHDVMLQLRWIAEGGSSVGLPQPVAHRRKHREWLAWGVAAVGFAAAAALAAGTLMRAPADIRVLRFGIFPNSGTAFGPENAGIRPFPAISPDGKRIVFQAQEANEPVHLWVRSLDAMDAQKLQGTENASIPFWSPDSRFIAFTADGKLKRIDADGGPVQVLTDVPTNSAAAEGTWGVGGTILYAHGPGVAGPANEGIFQIPDTGGKPVVILAPNKERKETVLRAPYFLPDGKHFLYLAQDPNMIWVGSLDTSETPKLLLATDSRAVYAKEGYLLFVQQGNLMGQRFDAAKLVLSGTVFPVAENVRANATNGRAAFSIADNGTLVYREGTVSGGEGLLIAAFDREGKVTPLLKQPGDNRVPRLSPDEKHLAVERRPNAAGCTNCSDIWTVDLARGTNTRITFNKGDVRLGGWSHDGTRLFYAANPDGVYALFSKLASGVGNEDLLLKSDLRINSISGVSKNYLFYTVEDAATGNDIWYLPLTGADRTPKPFINTPFNQSGARLSPDGRWVVYQSAESGQNEVYVQPFPATGQRIPISVDTGVQPWWRNDGKELIYVTTRRVLMSADITISGSMLEASKPKRLFLMADGATNNYHLTRNGQGFLISTPPAVLTGDTAAAESLPLNVITNWAAALKQ